MLSWSTILDEANTFNWKNKTREYSDQVVEHEPETLPVISFLDVYCVQLYCCIQVSGKTAVLEFASDVKDEAHFHETDAKMLKTLLRGKWTAFLSSFKVANDLKLHKEKTDKIWRKEDES